MRFTKHVSVKHTYSKAVTNGYFTIFRKVSTCFMRTKALFQYQTRKLYLLWIKAIHFNLIKNGTLKNLGEQEVTKIPDALAEIEKFTFIHQNLALCSILYSCKQAYNLKRRVNAPSRMRSGREHLPEFLHVNFHTKEALSIIGLMKPKYKTDVFTVIWQWFCAQSRIT